MLLSERMTLAGVESYFLAAFSRQAGDFGTIHGGNALFQLGGQCRFASEQQLPIQHDTLRAGCITGGCRIKTDAALNPDRQRCNFSDFLKQNVCGSFGSYASGFAAFGNESVNG